MTNCCLGNHCQAPFVNPGHVCGVCFKPVHSVGLGCSLGPASEWPDYARHSSYLSRVALVCRNCREQLTKPDQRKAPPPALAQSPLTAKKKRAREEESESSGGGEEDQAKPKQKRKRYSIEEKVHVLKKLEEGKSTRKEIRSKYDIKSYTLNLWVREKDAIYRDYVDKGNKKKKAVTFNPLWRLHAGLDEFFEENERADERHKIVITGHVLGLRARQIRDHLLSQHAINEIYLSDKELAAMRTFTGSDSWGRKHASARGYKSITHHGYAGANEEESPLEQLQQQAAVKASQAQAPTKGGEDDGSEDGKKPPKGRSVTDKTANTFLDGVEDFLAVIVDDAALHQDVEMGRGWVAAMRQSLRHFRDEQVRKRNQKQKRGKIVNFLKRK